MKIVLTKEQALKHLKTKFEFMFGTALSGESIEVEITNETNEDDVNSNTIVIDTESPSDGDWLPNTFNTKKCPDSLKGKYVDAILRDGYLNKAILASNLYWFIQDNESDIIEYRVVG